VELELLRSGAGFEKQNNLFLAVDDVATPQTAANGLSPELIRERLRSWISSGSHVLDTRTGAN
jgi:hypothetical protein